MHFYANVDVHFLLKHLCLILVGGNKVFERKTQEGEAKQWNSDRTTGQIRHLSVFICEILKDIGEINN